MNIDESNKATEEHIRKVRIRMAEVVDNLLLRAALHDASKLIEPEASGYALLTTRLENIVYGSNEYRTALQEAREVIAHHYAQNTHHPEHWPAGITDMSLLDILEMFCDWKAAGERTKDGSIVKSIDLNSTRFQMSDQLIALFRNTAQELGWK